MTDNTDRSGAKAEAHDTVALDIPNARGDVSVVGADRIFFKVLIDGEPASRRGGGWTIPLRNGSQGTLKARGFIPGFQTLYMDGREVLRMGAHVGLAERVAMFMPLILIIFLFPGLVLGLILFFMNVMAVKNPLMPRAVRIAVPIVNTIAGVLILLLLPSVVG